MLGWLLAGVIVAGAIWFVMKVHKDSGGDRQDRDGGNTDPN